MRTTFKRQLLRRPGLLCAFMLLSFALPAVAGAHVFDGKTRLTLDAAPALFFNAGARVVVSGQLRSGVTSCRAGRLVRLFSVKDGSARLVARDRTNGGGEFRFVVRPKSAKRLFVTFAGSIRASYGHHHRCAPSTSRTLTLRRA